MNGTVDGQLVDYAKIVVVTGDLTSIADKNDTTALQNWTAVVRHSILEQRPVDFVALHVQGLQHAGHDFAERLQSEFVDNEEFVNNFNSSLMLVELKNTGLGSLYFCRAADSCLVWNHESNSYAPVLGHKGTSMMSTGMMKSGALSQPDANSDEDVASSGPSGYALCRLQLHGRIDVSFVNLSLYNNDRVLRKTDAEKPKEFASMHGAVVARRDDAIGFDYGTTTRYQATVTPHRFDLLDQHQWLFSLAGGRLVRKYDMELVTTLAGRLTEHKPVHQPNRYYYKETILGRVDNAVFCRHRCPHWGDRIAFNDIFRDATHFDAFSASGVYYQMLGLSEEMGEAKPVSLTCTLAVKKDWRHE